MRKSSAPHNILFSAGIKIFFHSKLDPTQPQKTMHLALTLGHDNYSYLTCYSNKCIGSSPFFPSGGDIKHQVCISMMNTISPFYPQKTTRNIDTRFNKHGLHKNYASVTNHRNQYDYYFQSY